MSQAAEEHVIHEFNEPDVAQRWQVVNDTVMGGRSSSTVEVAGGVMVFSGTVSLEKRGGFASVGTAPEHHDLSGHDGVAIRVRGDGKRYALTLRTDAFLEGVLYQQPFETRAGEPMVFKLPFVDFVPTYHGQRLAGAPALSPAKITSLGLLIADQQEGEFRLEVEWIKAYR
jgi:NADH dehydrogenase [ubiquinone] 1 alpha subcomplex assembly factor 1